MGLGDWLVKTGTLISVGLLSVVLGLGVWIYFQLLYDAAVALRG